MCSCRCITWHRSCQVILLRMPAPISQDHCAAATTNLLAHSSSSCTSLSLTFPLENKCMVMLSSQVWSSLVQQSKAGLVFQPDHSLLDCPAALHRSLTLLSSLHPHIPAHSTACVLVPVPHDFLCDRVEVKPQLALLSIQLYGTQAAWQVHSSIEIGPPLLLKVFQSQVPHTQQGYVVIELPLLTI